MMGWDKELATTARTQSADLERFAADGPHILTLYNPIQASTTFPCVINTGYELEEHQFLIFLGRKVTMHEVQPN